MTARTTSRFCLWACSLKLAKKKQKNMSSLCRQGWKNRAWLLTSINLWEIINKSGHTKVTRNGLKYLLWVFPSFRHFVPQENGSADFLHARHIHAGTVFYQLKILHKWKARINNLIRRQKSRSWWVQESTSSSFGTEGRKKKSATGGPTAAPPQF